MSYDKDKWVTEFDPRRVLAGSSPANSSSSDALGAGLQDRFSDANIAQRALSVDRQRSRAEGETLIGLGANFRGSLECQSSVRIEGFLEGEILSGGEVTVGEAAEVKARINGDSVKVFGTVVGDITAVTRLEVFSGARISGNISSPRLVMHDGVVFDGHCAMFPEAGRPGSSLSQSIEKVADKSS